MSPKDQDPSLTEHIMSGLETAAAVLELAKEVYLIYKFVSRTLHDAAHAKSQRNQLLLQVDFEFGYVQSFGCIFLKRKEGIIENERLNQEWTQRLVLILDNLRFQWSDYAKLAERHDSIYQKYSTINTAPLDDTKLLEDFEVFDKRVTKDLEQEAKEKSASKALESNTSTEASPISRSVVFPHIKLPHLDLHFALREKGKLEKTLAKTKVWTQMLKDLTPLLNAAIFNRKDVSVNGLREIAKSSHAETLGLVKHFQIIDIEHDRLDSTSAPTDLGKEGDSLRLGPGTTIPLPAQLISTDPAKAPISVLVESKRVPATATKKNSTNALKLARLLKASTSELGTLRLRGYLEHTEDDALDSIKFIFDYPDGAATAPITLHEIVTKSARMSPGLSLVHRFHIAKTVARTLLSLHADGWLHKSIRSDSILLFKGVHGLFDFWKPYIANFEYARSTGTPTGFDFDEDKEKNLYRHPDRQGPPGNDFNKVYDLYALGTVLLEIGLWQPLGSLWTEYKGRLIAGDILDPTAFQQDLIRLAETELLATMGFSYASAVQMCLKGDFGIPHYSPNFTIAVYDHVVEKLDSKCLQATFEM